MLTKTPPSVGKILISEPFLSDPNFKRSVILLVEHGVEGTLGFVLNQLSSLNLNDLIKDFPPVDVPVFLGGPVEVDTLHFIHRCYDKMLSGDPIGDGLYWGGNFETLKVLFEQQEISTSDVKFFLGYAGWGKNQLTREIAEKTWLVSSNYQVSSLFELNEEDLWRELIVNLGPRYAHISNFPDDPSLN